MDATAPTALVIEDTPLIQRYLRFRLVLRGWNVAEAGDAYAGLKVARELRPDLITLDLVTPINHGIDGIHLARQIREESPHTVVLIVSGLASEPDVKDFMTKHDFELFGKDPADVGGFACLFSRIDELFVELGRLEQLAGDALIKH